MLEAPPHNSVSFVQVNSGVGKFRGPLWVLQFDRGLGQEQIGGKLVVTRINDM